MRWLCLGVALMGVGSCHDAAEAPLAALPADVPGGWAAFPGGPDSHPLRCADYWRSDWRVGWVDGFLRVVPAADERENDPLPFVLAGAGEDGLVGDRHVLRVADGYLVGFDAGEFGGGLWWVDATGGNKRRLTLPSDHGSAPDNVHAISPTGEDAIVIVGLGHMALNSGRAVLVSGKPGHPVTLIGNLGGAPRVVLEEAPGTLSVLTFKGLVRVRATGSVEELAELPDLFSRDPNSIVRAPTGAFFVGMHRFVARITVDSKKVETLWLVPDGCQ